jgi:phosphoribosylglycinamide formyltransferase-1
MMSRLGVLISGRGSNLQSLIDATRSGELRATIVVVVSNRPEAAGLARARDVGIPTVVLRPQDYSSRFHYDTAVADILKARGVELVCLAGFMRLIGAPLLAAYPNRILNIHPSLLPAFPGLNAQAQALDHGVGVSGVTVHLVTAGLDDGPIVMQQAVPVMDDDTVASLAARILVEEHKLYPAAVKKVLQPGWHIVGRRFVCTPGVLPGE